MNTFVRFLAKHKIKRNRRSSSSYAYKILFTSIILLLIDYDAFAVYDQCLFKPVIDDRGVVTEMSFFARVACILQDAYAYNVTRITVSVSA